MPKVKRPGKGRGTAMVPLTKPSVFKAPYPELKVLSVDTGNITPGTNTPTLVDLVSGVAVGAAYNQRVGNRINIRRIRVNLFISSLASSDTAAFGMRGAFDDDSAAADFTFGTAPHFLPDPNVSSEMTHWQYGNYGHFQYNASDASITRTFMWVGNFPVQWDRAGNVVGAKPVMFYVTSEAAAAFRFVYTVEWTDA